MSNTENAVKTVLVTGGAGYVGSVLVPKLLKHGYRVKVLDLYIYGCDVLREVDGNTNLEQVRGDLRDQKLLKKVVPGCDAVIHLACISNDPSFELNPDLGRSINYDAFGPLVDISIDSGVRRFIYASSSSVYGLKDEIDVTEDLPLKPLTDYSKYKALCEELLLSKRVQGFSTVIIRPATICGYSPRLRLDLTVNILTNHAINNREIKVFGGQQMRPNFHIEDMADLYVRSLDWPDQVVDGQIFNAGFQNYRVQEIAEFVRDLVGSDVKIVSVPTDDHRSYHISSQKIRRLLGYVSEKSIQDAVRDLIGAFERGHVPNPMSDARYYNLRQMQAIGMN